MRKTYIRRRIVVCIAAILSIMAVNAVISQPEVVCEVPVVRAQAGDTMWSLGEKYCPDFSDDMGDVVHIIIDMNGTSQVQVGQMVVLPWKEGK